MGEEVNMSQYEEERVLDWESGLPTMDDLTPLSQALIPPELASAFSISPLQHRTDVEVSQASRDTLSSLRASLEGHHSPPDENEAELFDADPEFAASSEPRKGRRTDDDDEAARTLKRPRLVWTPQLHKRFVDVVGHLGIKNAVPKTIMQLMNVEGLTRENVASHLQKYRLYLKRMQGLSNEGPSPSDHLFSSTPVHDSYPPVHDSYPVPMPVMPMPMMPPPPPIGYHHHHHHYGMLHQHHQQQRDWSANNYGSALTYPHMAPTDN